MPQSVARVAIHLVFSTKLRKPWLRDPGLRVDLHKYMATIMRDNVDSPALIINSVEDHVHALFLLSRKVPLMRIVGETKTETSKWLKKQSDGTEDFAWQGGYGAFSVSESNIANVRGYIEDQEEHHRKMSFQDEFRLLCKRHNIELDERYAWD